MNKEDDLMPEKMSKSSDNKAHIGEISDEVRISALESEVRYWKTRYELLEKYGDPNRKGDEQ
jgi:predicted  nucleic acid-binding Zn-ribbon protein